MNPNRQKLRAPRALSNDEDRLLTFDELVEKYEKRIYNLILRQIGDSDEAADLTQDTFVNAFRAFGSFRGECKISTWLYQIALNACKNRFRQRDRQREIEAVSLDAPPDPQQELDSREIPDWRASPERELQRNELHRQIRRAIAALPEEYRAVLVLCDLQGHSYLEIARLTNLSLEAVKTRIHRGRLMVRRKLEGYLKD